jgi:hypothetical protein
MHTAEKLFQSSFFEKSQLREHISSVAVEDLPRLDAVPDPTFNFNEKNPFL